MWNNGPCCNAYKVQLINHSNHSCLVLELETSCDMRYHLGPLYHMRFFNGNFFIWVHQTTLVFWVHYSTWVFKKYGSIKPGIFSLMCFDGPIFYFSFWKSDVVWWTQKTDVVWWTLILMWFDGPFRSIKPHLCQKFCQTATGRSSHRIRRFVNLNVELSRWRAFFFLAIFRGSV